MRKSWLKTKLCNWLYKPALDEMYDRLEADLYYEKDKLRKEYAEKHDRLELMYADYKRQNEYLTNLLVERENLNPRPIMITKDSVN